MHIRITNGVPTPYTIGQLRRDNPQTSFPKSVPDEMLASYAVYPVKVVSRPDYDPLTQTLKQSDFYQVDGQWQVHYYPDPLPVDQAADNIRAHRGNLLAETDWLVIKAYERNENISAEWEVYRQELRDITAQQGFPYSVEWPTKPE
jgi:hypothetical protein